MQQSLLPLLQCPVAHTPLRMVIFSEREKQYASGAVMEVWEGLLHSTAGFVYPIIDGIPRLLVESMCDYAGFLKKHLTNYDVLLQKVKQKHHGLLGHCIKKNKRTKASFAFEWKFLNTKKDDKLWHRDTNDLLDIFLSESGLAADEVQGKVVLDAGAGHGLMTQSVAKLAGMAIGAELSQAVEKAYQMNEQANVHYIQADLQYLPLVPEMADILYSSGVIHHTDNTELSLTLIEEKLKPGGNIVLWLYHPQTSLIHNAILQLRKITRKLPVRLNFVLLSAFVFPITFTAKKIKNKRKLNAREEIIDLLDGFTPEFRNEIPHDVAEHWLHKRGYKHIEVTTKDTFGYSIAATKKSSPQ